MAERIEHDAGVYAVRSDPELGALVVEWYDDVDGSALRTAMERLLAHVREREATKLLVDAREQGTMDGADRTWLAEEWVPAAVDAGLQYTAHVYPDGEAAKSSVDRFGRTDPFNAVERLFTEDVESAREWLRRQ